jgi:hypothetical protein
MQRILSNRGFKTKKCDTNEMLFEKQISDSAIGPDPKLPYQQSSDMHVKEELTPAGIETG